MENDFMATLGSFTPIVLMVIIFYFLLYRPQKKAREAHDTMLSNLKVGNRVITIGGIYGTITAITDEVITLKIANNVEIEIARGSISGTASKEKEGS